MALLPYIIFAGGLVALVFGGDWLVKGAVALAERFSVPPLVIGLTIVAFGTSAPELVISLQAALSGSGALAIGNVVGSNIANVLLVLGAPALIAVISSNEAGLKRSLFYLMAVTALFVFELQSGEINRWNGLLLLGCLALFLAQQFLVARNDGVAPLTGGDDYHDELGPLPKSMGRTLLLLLAGIITLPLAAHFTVSSAVTIAEQWMVPEEVIGLTIVAIGTSLPELATGISAARNGNSAVGIGNVIGSNFFNIAAIIGITAVITPIPVGAHVLKFDIWAMVLTTVLLIAFPLFRLQIGRGLGALLLLSYVGYLAFTVAL